MKIGFPAVKNYLAKKFVFKVKIEHFPAKFHQFLFCFVGLCCILNLTENRFLHIYFYRNKINLKAFSIQFGMLKNTTKKSDAFAWKGTNFDFFENLFIKSGFGAYYL